MKIMIFYSVIYVSLALSGSLSLSLSLSLCVCVCVYLHIKYINIYIHIVLKCMLHSLSLTHTHTHTFSLSVYIYTHVTGDCCRLIYYIHRPLITDWLHILNSVKFSDPTFPIQISDPSLPSKFTIVGSENNDNKSEDEKEREFLRREQLKNISMRRLNEVYNNPNKLNNPDKPECNWHLS